ncbi:hypothetical protein L1887_17562 [Cichorium endivia]|nr:hypothetical protein L1887_17562 [Cichorium endivia]
MPKHTSAYAAGILLGFTFSLQSYGPAFQFSYTSNEPGCFRLSISLDYNGTQAAKGDLPSDSLYVHSLAIHIQHILYKLLW